MGSGSSSGGGGGAFDRGCEFVLEQPRDGLNAVRSDMKTLPASTLPLLGHTAIIKSKQSPAPFEKWRLECK
jgi:hypothetical protein